jgi:murein DD-endopeptidase MepM/ murein hydrolase activator NlpD
MWRLTFAFACGLGACASVAIAGPPTGGAAATPAATISSVACRTDCAGPRAARPGSFLRLRGFAMRRVRTVIFLGDRGDRDDVIVPVAEATPHSVVVKVPAGAPPGRLRTRSANRGLSPPSRVGIEIAVPAAGAAEPPVPGPDGHVFPVRGPHDYGGPQSRFGAHRHGHSHQGHDVFAACGTPLVAARGGVVRWRAWHSRAGNYVVVAGDGTALDYVYMHLQSPSGLARGVRVATGQPIGAVGDTGAASGCHLHFELWSAPGWYEGGRPFDPLAHLRAWDV